MISGEHRNLCQIQVSFWIQDFIPLELFIAKVNLRKSPFLPSQLSCFPPGFTPPSHPDLVTSGYETIQLSGFKNTHLSVSHTTNSKLRFTFWFHALGFTLAWVCKHATAQKQLYLTYFHPAIITYMGLVSLWTVMTTAFYYDFIKQRAHPSCCLPVGVTLFHFTLYNVKPSFSKNLIPSSYFDFFQVWICKQPPTH